MKNSIPLVSIIIPCLDEENFIGKCLDSIIGNDFPKDRLEVFVVDGMSNDGTRILIRKYEENYQFIKLLDNEKKITPIAMNLGIKAANGEYIVILGCHSRVDRNFIRANIDAFDKYDVDCVGGVLVTQSVNETLIAQAITIVLSHPFGIGNAFFRIGSKKPTYVDTVPFGCYRKEVFDKIGFFEDKLIRNQDIEFNLRLKRAGGKILLVPGIVSYYHARSSLKDLFRQNFWNGFWVIYSLNFAEAPFSVRHLIPFIFISSLVSSFILSLFYNPFIYSFIFIIGIYTIANLSFSFIASIKKGLKYFPFLLTSFLTLHVSYGLGSIWGIVRLFLSKLTKPKVAM